VRAFVQGVTAAATGAIAGAVVVLGKHSIQDYWTAGIAVTTFLILMKWKVPEPLIILVAGVLGIRYSSQMKYRLFLAVRRQGSQPAAIRVFTPVQ